MTSTPRRWRLKSKEERRFKQGHPWVYSNELQESPKGVSAGDWIRLEDASGAFLALGFGNPSSLIAFRALTRNPKLVPTSDDEWIDFFAQAIRKAFEFRLSWFDPEVSFRAVFGECDELPGLVIDRYRSADLLKSGKVKTVYVLQPHSAGMDRHLLLVLQGLRKAHALLFGDPKVPENRLGERTLDSVVVIRRDMGSRLREGLEKIPTQVLDLSSMEEIPSGDELSQFRFLIPGVARPQLALTVDLIKGQKTGYFFDQLENVRLLAQLALRKRTKVAAAEISILDLCCYVGQWSVQVSDALLRQQRVNVTLVDASESALEMARQNLISLFGAEIEQRKLEINFIKADVLDPIQALQQHTFDIVIADPPALIKSRKVIPQGKQAYVQLMSEALRRTKPGGLMVACSCSQLLSDSDFAEVLAKAERKGHQRNVRWIAQGSHSLDHFKRFDFQEGQYLKCWIGQVTESSF